jgi:hypothetical protein
MGKILKNLGTLVLGTVFVAGLTFNSYSQNIENTIVAYVTPNKNKGKLTIKYDSIKTYNVQSTGKVIDLLLKGEGLHFNPPLKIYCAQKDEGKIYVIPLTSQDKEGYNFLKDKPEKIEKEVQDLLRKDNIEKNKIFVLKPVKIDTPEMYNALIKKKK